MEGLEGELVLGLNQAPSMNAVLRALKREEASMFCCVASIAHDAQFVQQVCASRLVLAVTWRCYSGCREPLYNRAGSCRRRTAVHTACRHVSHAPGATSLSKSQPPPTHRWRAATHRCRCLPTCAAGCGTWRRRCSTPATSSPQTATTTTCVPWLELCVV